MLEEFEKYFKPAHNKYHTWYQLGSIYSSPFKSQSEFMNKLHDVVKECGFDANVSANIVKFLFLTHNQNAKVCEKLLKSINDGDSLHAILGYARLVEGTMHSEHLSRAYLDTV